MTTISRNISADFQGRPFGERGNILIYVLMTMVIFGLIGVTMVSLFSTSVSSSATANETRRAFYLSESGIRYAISELRQGGFSATNVNRINANPFSVPPAGSFRVTVLGAWFQSPSNQNVAGGTLAVELEKGRIPTGFSARLNSAVPDLYLVVAGLDPRSTTQTPNANEVANVNSFTASSDTAGSFDIADQLVVGRDKRICMAVQPRAGADQSFTPSAGGSAGSLELRQRAAAIFPKTDGSFLFAGKAYFYRSAVEDTANGVFRLNDISAGPNVTNAQVTVTAADYILLAPNNYFVTSKGTTAGNVEFGGDMDHAAALASHSAADLSEPDLAVAVGDVAQIESGSSFMGGGTDTQGDYLQIGSSRRHGRHVVQPEPLPGRIHGLLHEHAGHQQPQGCFFESGMRAYFTLEYSGTGDGLIFALINGQLNQLASAGGDFEATELLGYAGDSRTNNSGGFLDTTGIKGLRPPKMGLEFDTKRNWDPTFEAKPTDFCSGSTLRQNTRNDPDPASATKDFVQYVYWGNTSGVNVPCRTTPNDRSSTYDDNRHNPGCIAHRRLVPVAYRLGQHLRRRQRGRQDDLRRVQQQRHQPHQRQAILHRAGRPGLLTPGSGRPFFAGSNGVTSPVLDSNGNIYVGAGNSLYLFRPDRSLRFSYTLQNGTRASTPVIGPDGTIYVSAYDGVKFGCLYAINPDGSLKPGWTTNPQIHPVLQHRPRAHRDGSLVIAATDAQRVYALRTSDGLPDPDWGLTGAFLAAGPKNAPGVGPGATAKGTVYVAAGDRRVYALSGEDGSTLLTSPAFASEGLSTQPVVAGGTVYVGSFDDHLYALDTSNLSVRWSYHAAGNVQSSPVVDSNGTFISARTSATRSSTTAT